MQKNDEDNKRDEIKVVELEELRKVLLKLINASPEGLSLVAAGARLNIKWRKLIRPVKDLLDEGKITKSGIRYYQKR